MTTLLISTRCIERIRHIVDRGYFELLVLSSRLTRSGVFLSYDLKSQRMALKAHKHLSYLVVHIIFWSSIILVLVILQSCLGLGYTSDVSRRVYGHGKSTPYTPPNGRILSIVEIIEVILISQHIVISQVTHLCNSCSIRLIR